MFRTFAAISFLCFARSRRHTRFSRDWSSDVCSSDLAGVEQGADYIGAGPVWETPSKLDAGSAIGLDGLAAICEAVRVPVVAIGGIDASTAGDCISAGAKGVAVVRASADARGVRAAVDAAAF